MMEKIEEVLTLALNGTDIVELCRGTGLKPEKCRRLLTFLQGKRQLLISHKSRWLYYTTSRGRKFLDGLKELEAGNSG